MPKTDKVRSAIRVLQLMEAVNRLQVASVAQLQASTGLPKATIVRLAQTLVSEGYLCKRGVGFAVPVLTDGGVAATVGIRYLGSAMNSSDAVRRYLPALRSVAVEISAALAAAGKTFIVAALKKLDSTSIYRLMLHRFMGSNGAANADLRRSNGWIEKNRRRTSARMRVRMFSTASAPV